MRLRFLSVVLGLFLAARSWAHDPLEITVDVQPDAKTMVVHVTMSRSVAAYLAGLGEQPRRYFAPENFAPNQEKFDRAASDLCLLRRGDAPQTLSKGAARLTEESDVEFVLTYPAPATGGALHFGAKWFDRLPPEGYITTFAIRGEGHKMAGRPLLYAEKPSIDFELDRESVPSATPTESASAD